MGSPWFQLEWFSCLMSNGESSFLDCTNSNRVTLPFQNNYRKHRFFNGFVQTLFLRRLLTLHWTPQPTHKDIGRWSTFQSHKVNRMYKEWHDGCFYVHATCMCIICIYFNTLTQSVSRDTQNTRGKNKKWEKHKRQNAFSDKCGRKKYPQFQRIWNNQWRPKLVLSCLMS